MFHVKFTHSHKHVTKCSERGKALTAILLSPHSGLHKQPLRPPPHASVPFFSIHVCLKGLCFSGPSLRSHSYSDSPSCSLLVLRYTLVLLLLLLCLVHVIWHIPLRAEKTSYGVGCRGEGMSNDIPLERPQIPCSLS